MKTSFKMKTTFKTPALFLTASVVAAFAACAFTCGSNPSNNAPAGFGMIEVRARIVNPPAAKVADVADVAQTAPTVLVIEVSGTDLYPTRVETPVNFSRPSVIDTIRNVPVGNNRRISIWAEDAAGNITHMDSIETRVVSVQAETVTPVFATFLPAQGSIYLQLLGLNADYVVHALFQKQSDSTVVAEDIVSGAPITFIALNNIPHLTAGILRVKVIEYYTETVKHYASQLLTFNARTDSNIDLNFIGSSGDDGGIEMNITFYAAGITSGTFDFGNMEASSNESGEVFMTEIMWHAAGENYIELYNPSDEVLFFDTLIIDITTIAASSGNVNNNHRRFVGVNFEPQSYLVFGRTGLPHVDHAPLAQQTLGITTTLHSITVRRRNNSVIDRVLCASRNCVEQGWPTAAQSPANTIPRRSIELMPDAYNAISNNFGNRWRFSTATEPIEGVSSAYVQLGTPGRGPQ